MGTFGRATIEIYHNKKLTPEAYRDIIETLCESTDYHFELDDEDVYDEEEGDGCMYFSFSGKGPHYWEDDCSALSREYNLRIIYEYTTEYGDCNYYKFENGERELTEKEKMQKKIEELETRNKELETRNKELEKQLINNVLDKKLKNNDKNLIQKINSY